MPNVMIDCPVTKKPMPIGLVMSAETFAAAKLEGNVIDDCPHCGQAHLWGKREAYLEGTRPAEPKPDEEE